MGSGAGKADFPSFVVRTHCRERMSRVCVSKPGEPLKTAEEECPAGSPAAAIPSVQTLLS